MFAERYRSHHDAEAKLASILGLYAHSRSGTVDWEDVERPLYSAPPSGRRCIYIHVPYCDTICEFCNLNRTARGHTDLDAYTEYLIKEIEWYARYPYIRDGQFDAIYFGGGTPTILQTEQLSLVLRALRDSFHLSEDCEITLESTLHNLPAEKSARLQQEGVNRLSLGVQTFSSRGRSFLGRTGDAEYAIARLRAIRQLFSGVLGIDIIYSYFDQSLEEVAHDASLCSDLSLDGASFYSLMIHDGSSLGQRIAKGEIPFGRSLEDDRQRHNRFYEDMHAGGYEMLELSKLVRPGRDEYRYIRIRYENGDVLPIGAGAGGQLAGYRIYSMAQGRRFASKIEPAYAQYHRVLGHLQFGCYDLTTLSEELGPDSYAPLRERMDYFVRNGMLVPETDDLYTLTADGIFWGNNIAVDILKAAIDGTKEHH